MSRLKLRRLVGFLILLVIMFSSSLAIGQKMDFSWMMFLPAITGGRSTPEAATCDSTHLDLCTTSSTCTNIGGYWWTNNTCNSTTEQPPGTVISVGQVWMDRNLGASQVATSLTNRAAYGDMYQWGRVADGHEKRTSGTTTTRSSTDVPGHGSFIKTEELHADWRVPRNDSLWQGVSGTNNPCPAGFRLPTYTELKIELASWGNKYSEGAFASPLKLVLTGIRSGNSGTKMGVGLVGDYWTSTTDGVFSFALHFHDTWADMYYYNRANGHSVRCIKD